MAMPRARYASSVSFFLGTDRAMERLLYSSLILFSTAEATRKPPSGPLPIQLI